MKAHFVFFTYVFVITAQWISIGNCTNEKPPLGHLLPLGSHTKPGSIEELDEVPSAEQFWREYVRPSKPVIFRAIAKSYPAFTKWTDDYLKKTFGKLEVRLEGKKEKSSYIPVGNKGVGRDTLENFIDSYHYSNSNKYIVSELPAPMYEDVLVPPCLGCGTFADRLVEIDIWMSGGGTRSILHKDAYNTLNCILNGTKEWKLIEYKYEKDIYKAWEGEGEVGGFSRINPDKVDLIKYPKIAKIPWYHATVNAGDCLFLPKSMYHQVKSFGTHNLAVAILFARFDNVKELDFKHCSETKYQPLSKFDIDWQYPGHGIMSMGNIDLDNLKNIILSKCGKSMNSSAVLKFLKTILSYSYSIKSNAIVNEMVEQWFQIFGKDRRDTLSTKDLDMMSKDQLRKLAKLIFPEEPANTYEHEYFYIKLHNIHDLIHRLLVQGDLDRETFIDGYVNSLHGSEEFALKLFNSLGGDSVKSIPKAKVFSNIFGALKPYAIRQEEPISAHNGNEMQNDAYSNELDDVDEQTDSVESIYKPMENREEL